MANFEAIQSNTFRNYVVMLGDTVAKDDIKLKAAQELSEHFEGLIQCSSYPSVLEHLIKVFLRILEEGEPQFIQENASQNIRKLVLEMIHRLPICESLRQHVKPIISLMLKLLKIENEENVLVCLRIIIELHKNFRPSFNPEVQQFLIYVKNIYMELPNHVPKIFEPSQPLRVKDLKDLSLESLLLETYMTRIIHLEKSTESGNFSQTYNLLPKGVLSLRVLQELPIIVVLIYQIYKNAVHQEVAEFVPLIMTTINLQPPHFKETPFSKEVSVDFMGAQIKTLSFLAYVVRIFQDSVMSHSAAVVNGVLSLMQSCPNEAAHLRKELLIAARHIFATDLRQKFIPFIERLFDEDLLIGKGVTLDAIRPLAYSTLADLAHHVRQSLNLDILEIAANLFSKNVHDETLATGIQTMSCKLLLNLVDCIRQHSESNPLKARKVLIMLLKAFTIKFRTISMIQLPQIMQKWKSYSTYNNGISTTAIGSASECKEGSATESTTADSLQKLSSSGCASSVNVSEYRSLVKTLVGGVKTITWGCISCKPISDALKSNNIKLFEPEELGIYIELVNWALEVLDIYTITIPSGNIYATPIQRSTGHIPRTKEEKEVLEHFSGIFLMMHAQNFQEIFETTVSYVVERIYKNPSLQVIANSFLANPTTSPLFATVLVEYLLERMEEMGSNIERSNLYLRLFKLVFGSVSLFPVENEQMLRPHLHKIVNKSMELALTAEEPYNYFLLLRALFRSIGGGSHDLLYQEFLPLLPNLLEGLNRLQSGFHKQHMKDLFVELCLTVPVRLSSLLPYLPMLMDPLVSALNGSATLISQGLRTLELCVDNLQPDFLYDHIQPVRAALMQALWRTLRNQDNAALVAFRILGKFGGGNRKMMIEPQTINYCNGESDLPSIITYFQDQKEPVIFPVDNVIQTAFNLLNCHTTDSYYRRQSWQAIKYFLAASIKLDDEKFTLHKLFMHPSFVEATITNISSFHFVCKNSVVRKTHQIALSGMLVASATKELRESVFPVMVGMVRHYTMIAIAQQAGPFNINNHNNSNGIDPLVLIDALAFCMGHEEKELCKPGQLCIALILETATHLMGSKERACRLPIMQYLAEKMTALCYERPWYSKMGGCKSMNWLYQNMSLRWIYQHLFAFLKAFMFVIMDLTEDVSNGTVDIAKDYLKALLETCMAPLENTGENEEIITIQNKAIYEALHELVRQVTSPNSLVRNEAMSSLKLIAKLHEKSVSEIMDPHREVLVDIIPPKKHLLRHQPASAQIGLMDGNTFCTTLEPRLFTINLSNSYHKLFFHELLTLSEAEDSTLTKLDCYKNVSNLVPLRKSALRALAACNYITDNLYREKIVNIMFRVMDNNNVELQEAAFESMKTFISGCHIEKEKVHAGMRPLLLTLGDHRNLSLSATKRLSFFTQLFPQMFNDKLSEQILQHCQKMMEISISTCKSAKQGGNFLSVAKTGEYEKRIVTLIGMFHQITAASSKYIESLCQLVLQTERTLQIEPTCPYREPLIKFLLRFPRETVNLFFSEVNICNPQWNRFFIFLLNHKDGEPFRAVIKLNKSSNLIKLILLTSSTATQLNNCQKYEAQHQSVLIIFTVMELDDQWIPTQNEIVCALKSLWVSDLYKTCETNVVCDLWHLIGKILLLYFSHNTNEIDLLFQLLRALCFHFIPDFKFLRDFLQNTVAQSYTVYWKRNAFFYFVEHFNNTTLSDELKAKILTTILIPCFSISFEKGEGNKLIGAPPAPYQEDENNIVSVFVSKLFDPEKPFANDDVVRIALLQFACLLVEKASPHIHDGDANNKRQGNKLRRLMTFAWPCLLNKNCVDPTSRYHGHLLLAHIIARLAIHKKIVLQVFHSLLKGHALEARPIVRQALDVLTPAMPLRMEDGNTMLTHWTKKILVEEGHAIQQLFHILQLIVRHYKVYYPVRHHLVAYMTNYMQRLGFPPNASLEHKKLAVELAEVIIKWELQRIKDDDSFCKHDGSDSKAGSKLSKMYPLKRTCNVDLNENKTDDSLVNISDSAITVLKPEGINRSIDKSHCDNVLNFLIRLACHVNDMQSIPGIISPGEGLSRRCVLLLKMAMRPDVWAQPFDLKLSWLDKIFISIESTQANVGNICTGLDILTFLITILKNDQVLAIVRPIQRGLSSCVIHHNTRIIRLMHVFLTRLMAIFEPDTHQKHEDLDILYGTVNKMVVDNLTNYEKSTQPSSPSLFGTLMILKACCSNNVSFMDRLVFQFMRVLNRLTKDHLSFQVGNNLVGSQIEGSHLTVELLILSLELVKNRLSIMGLEIRKLLIGSILASLIEKSSEVKILKCIVKLVDEWIRIKSNNTLVVNIPSLREKSILLVKLMQYIEKKFADDFELNAQFLELISYIYRDEYLKQTELTAKLEGAFLSGLRCQQPLIRAKFFEILDASMRRRLHDRILYIICSQAWDAIGTHYWIKQCIELSLLTVNSASQIRNSNEGHMVPNISSVINITENEEERKNFIIYTSSEPDSFEPSELQEIKDNYEMRLCSDLVSSNECPTVNRQSQIFKIINRHIEFVESNRKLYTEQFLVSTAQLCHFDADLAENIWLEIFPRFWSLFNEAQHKAIMRELIPFLSSGTHILQRDCSPSAINTFIEGLVHCNPVIYIPPKLLTYLGKSHNLWHRMTLMLEDMSLNFARKEKIIDMGSVADINHCDVNANTLSQIYDSLSQMYSSMHEEDLWAGLWLKYAKYPDTNIAIAYEQMGFFEEAQGAYDLAMTKLKQDSTNLTMTAENNTEISLWQTHWIRCAKELNQWDILLDYAQSSKEKNYFLIMESAWRVPNWSLMKHALLNVEQSYPKQCGYKVNLYKGYLAILNQEEQQLPYVEKYVELSSGLCMREWRRLPRIVSHLHLQYLQAAQQIMELQEACQIHQGLIQCRNSSLHDMKAIVKTWRNRLPVISDDLSHWNDIFTWRQHHYQIITQNLEQQSDQGNSMLGVHASAQAIIHFGKVARKHNLTGVCQESLSRIYTIPSVPIVDCFQKIRQQVKCYLQMASISGRSELNEALEVIESTNLKYFTGEMNAEFYALKGQLLAQIGRSEDAGKAFSASAQLHDGLTKAWGLWGDYLEKIFSSDRQMVIGVSAIICFLHACRHQNERKSRKYIAKVLWLLSYDDSTGSLMNILEKYVIGVPPLHWLPWIPQLLCCLVQYDGNIILNLLSHVGRIYPQAVYFPIRTLYLTLKIEQREKHKTAEHALFACKTQNSTLDSTSFSQEKTSYANHSFSNSFQIQHPSQGPLGTTTSVNPIKATPSMWRCSKVMHVQREIHPTILSSLEGIVDQMVWFRESWTEEVLRQLRQGLIKCYAIAFENRTTVNDATITPHTLHFLKKLGSTFGIGIENIQGSVSSSSNSAASESLARRAQVTFQDPVFQKMKEQFTNDFDFSQPGAMKLHNLIYKLKTWIKDLETKVKKLPTSFLIEDKCRFLSNFSQKTAEVELPGELLMPSPSHYHIRIARFMPRVEIVQKNNTAARRLYIRGTNGQIYPYLVVIDSGLGDARREERVLQLMRMLNYYLGKQKETTKRFLHITVPRVVPISPQMRLADDNPASISLRELYKNECTKLHVDHENPIVKYYEYLSEVQARGTQTTHTVLRDIYHEVQDGMIPVTLIKAWALQNFRSSTDYWQFRKMFTLQLALSLLCEHAFYLTRLNADMMYIHQDSGLISVSYFKFDINDETGELSSNRPVPFRLTPNIAEFVTTIGITGPLSASFVATSRCFGVPNYKISSVLQAILGDEIIAFFKMRIKDEKNNTETIIDDTQDVNTTNKTISVVNKAVSAITYRLNTISYFDNMESNKISALILSARNPDNLCRMDPAWQPWL